MAIERNAITIVGCGPGSADYLTPAAISAIEQADVLVGARRLLELFPLVKAERLVVNSRIEDTLNAMERLPDDRRVVVLVTGDPGLFSLAKPIIKRFGLDRCRVIPGISSIQTAFARVGLDWADALIISAHKEDPDFDGAWLKGDKIAVLGGRKYSLKWIFEHFVENQSEPHRIIVCENLTLENEQIREVGPGDLPTLDVAPSTVVLLIKSSVLP